LSRLPQREELIEEVGGIRLGHRRFPPWLMLVIVGVVAWGLYYLITYSIKEAGSFKAPEIAAVRQFLRF
jgi:hypothetical protein